METALVATTCVGFIGILVHAFLRKPSEIEASIGALKCKFSFEKEEK